MPVWGRTPGPSRPSAARQGLVGLLNRLQDSYQGHGCSRADETGMDAALAAAASALVSSARTLNPPDRLPATDSLSAEGKRRSREPSE